MRNPRRGNRAPAFLPAEDEQPGTGSGVLPFKLGFLLERSRYKIIYGGRGSAKSWSVARAASPGRGGAPADSLHAGVSEFASRQFAPVAVRPGGRTGSVGFLHGSEKDDYRRQRNRVRFRGTAAHISKIKSFEGADIVWVEEGQNVSKQSYDVLIPTIRKPGSEIWITFNPDLEEDEVYQRFIVWPRPDARVQKMNWNDNGWLPEELRKEKDHLKARDLEAYNNVWEGHCRSYVAGALWTKEVFAENRDPAPENEAERATLLATLRRVVISIDPSGCSGEQDRRADEIGIIATGVGHDGIARVLEDATGRYAPHEWANKALELSDRWKADKIVAEVNYGGAMVEATIRTARRYGPIKVLNASRAKVQRAEPIAALYAQGKVRHVGHFPQLERQYCLFSTAGYMGTHSPDHADAGIWGLTELMLDTEPQPNIRFFNIHR
jgi:hypothetical protein